MEIRRWPDVLGMMAALGCALHCATLTAIFLFYPALWLKRRYWESGLWQKLLLLEWGLLLPSWMLIVLAMVLGWRRHGYYGPLVLALAAATALTLLITTPLHFSGRWTGLAALAAGTAVAAAHGWNLRLLNSRARQATSASG